MYVVSVGTPETLVPLSGIAKQRYTYIYVVYIPLRPLQGLKSEHFNSHSGGGAQLPTSLIC